MGLGLLSEMIQRPAFRPEEIASEANVVLEEINMNEDDPADVAHDQFAHALWDGHVLAKPVLGTKESITGMSRDAIRGYWARRYHPSSVVVAAAGYSITSDLVELVADRFGGWRGLAGDHDFRAPEITSAVRVVRPRHRAGAPRRGWRGNHPGRRSPVLLRNPQPRRGRRDVKPVVPRDSARNGAWPTPCTRSGCRTPTRAHTGSMSGRRPSRPARCSSWSAPNCSRSSSGGSPRRSSRGRRGT